MCDAVADVVIRYLDATGEVVRISEAEIRQKRQTIKNLFADKRALLEQNP